MINISCHNLLLPLLILVACRSTSPEEVIIEFYSSYFNAYKDFKTSAFQPSFLADENGMITLEFKQYVENLKSYHFSDRLITSDLESYTSCLTQLKLIKFSEMDSLFVELDDYEMIGCDFFNHVRWLPGRGMDTYDGVRVLNDKKIEENKHIYLCEVFLYDEKTKKYDTFGQFSVTMIKNNNQWEIDSID